MSNVWRSDWSVTAAIHYRMARFKLAAGVIRRRRRRQSDEVRRRSVNTSGLTPTRPAERMDPTGGGGESRRLTIYRSKQIASLLANHRPKLYPAIAGIFVNMQPLNVTQNSHHIANSHLASSNSSDSSKSRGRQS